jgi:hypothetical protein
MSGLVSYQGMPLADLSDVIGIQNLAYILGIGISGDDPVPSEHGTPDLYWSFYRDASQYVSDVGTGDLQPAYSHYDDGFFGCGLQGSADEEEELAATLTNGGSSIISFFAEAALLLDNADEFFTLRMKSQFSQPRGYLTIYTNAEGAVKLAGIGALEYSVPLGSVFFSAVRFPYGEGLIGVSLYIDGTRISTYTYEGTDTIGENISVYWNMQGQHVLVDELHVDVNVGVTSFSEADALVSGLWASGRCKIYRNSLWVQPSDVLSGITGYDGVSRDYTYAGIDSGLIRGPCWSVADKRIWGGGPSRLGTNNHPLFVLMENVGGGPQLIKWSYAAGVDGSYDLPYPDGTWYWYGPKVTIAGAGTSDANGDYYISEWYNNHPVWTKSAGIYIRFDLDSNWGLYVSGESPSYTKAGTSDLYVPESGSWVTGAGANPAPTQVNAFEDPF